MSASKRLVAATDEPTSGQSTAHEPSGALLQATEPDSVEASKRPVVVRGFLKLIGWGSIGLAFIGIPLPLLPTTPFLLLAAACFVRSSPELHQRLLQHPKLGPFLRQWQKERSVSRAAKHRAYAVVVISFTISILAVEGALLRAGLGLGAVALLVFLASLRTTRED